MVLLLKARVLVLGQISKKWIENVVYKKYFCKNFIISSNHNMLLLNCTGRHPSFYRGIKGILKLVNGNIIMKVDHCFFLEKTIIKEVGTIHGILIMKMGN